MAKNRNLKRDERFKLILYAAVVTLALTCLVNFLCRYFIADPAKWNTLFGLVIVVAIDAFIFKRYDKRLWTTKKNKNTGERISTDMTFNTIAMSNFLALAGSVGFGFLWLAFDEESRVIFLGILAEMSFSKGKMIIDLGDIALNVPTINLGLVIVSFLLLVSIWLGKHLYK